jgi:hypothetical protein
MQDDQCLLALFQQFFVFRTSGDFEEEDISHCRLLSTGM